MVRSGGERRGIFVGPGHGVCMGKEGTGMGIEGGTQLVRPRSMGRPGIERGRLGARGLDGGGRRRDLGAEDRLKREEGQGRGSKGRTRAAAVRAGVRTVFLQYRLSEYGLSELGLSEYGDGTDITCVTNRITITTITITSDCHKCT